jgi:hypothetical protein
VPPSQYNIVANSTFLDAFGALAVGSSDPAPALQALASNTANDVATAKQLLDPMLGYPGSPTSLQRADSGDLINVAVMVERAAPQSQLDALLAGDWADRQSFISNQGNNIWSTYGADPAVYASTQQAILAALDNPASNPMALAAAAGYSGTAENRTIWLQLRPEQFNTLFNSVLLADDVGYAWTGSLSLPSTIPLSRIAGLWVDQGILVQNPVHPNGVQPTTPGIGPVSLGNAAYGDYWIPDSHDINATVTATPAAIAAYYSFPLASGVAAAPIALLETGLDQPNLLAALNAYRQDLGLRPLSASELQSIGGTTVAPDTDQLELALDMSVISGVAPNSPIYLYGAAAKTSAVGNFQAYQNAFFDDVRNPEVLSSSYTYFFSMTENSPFQKAWQQLFVDGMLSGVSVHLAIGDQGSNGFQPNGAGNAVAGTVPTYALSVGGTSIASPFSAANDSTLGTIYQLAMQGDPETVFELVAAGLTTLPSKLSIADPATLMAGAAHNYAAELTQLIETVWNAYVFVDDGKHDKSVGFTDNFAGSGGVDQTQPVPSYQTAYGLTPGVTPASPNGSGRGAPDVSALAGGDAYWAVLNNDAFSHANAPTISGDDGTSAAAPLWATLTAQFNVIFKDQGLPTLGFYNDLLYIASAIAPASFNDIVLGNNTSGFYYTAHNSGYIANDQYIQPTDAGYAATPGYDLVSGLGTPNGTLLARALAQIAHEQMYFDPINPFLGADGSNWRTGGAESLLIQSSSTSDTTVHLSLGSVGTIFFAEESDPFAWTARLAQQSLQRDFDPSLVTMFDHQAQGALMQVHAGSGMHVGVSIDGVRALTPQAGITTPFGFADFTTTANAMGFNPDIRVALPVAIAETAGGANDTVAIVRLRQNGEDSLSVSFFKVDDYTGTINLGGQVYRPGDANYQAAAQDRAYLTQGGGASIGGPGYGQWSQTGLVNVDAGDIIAMSLTNNTHGQTFFSFARANEKVNGQDVGHLWNYGLNTWGFEDTYGGGDRDYNDMVIGLDFISTAGRGYLV